MLLKAGYKSQKAVQMKALSWVITDSSLIKKVDSVLTEGVCRIFVD